MNWYAVALLSLMSREAVPIENILSLMKSFDGRSFEDIVTWIESVERTMT